MKAIGPPSEVAMIKYAEQLINVHEFRRRYNIIFEIPFNSKRKYHLVIARMHSIGNKCRYLLLIKGAPEIIIKHCTRILGSEGEMDLNEDRMNEFQVSLCELQLIYYNLVCLPNLWRKRSKSYRLRTSAIQ
jgi:magnesium-transporting ATPase (P-type)